MADTNARTLLTAPGDARRLAAAWNACEGVPTAALESGAVAELVAACREVAPLLVWSGGADRFRAALARIGEGVSGDTR